MAKKILVVEDELIVAQDITNRLKRMGYEICGVASEADEAVEKARQLLPDIVLMDIVLKGKKDGIDAARRIMESFDIPVIYLTAHSDMATIERVKKSSPFGYMRKPFEDEEISKSIDLAFYKLESAKMLNENRRWLYGVLESIHEAVIVTDEKQIIKFMNPAADYLTGWREKDAIGRNLNDVFKTRDENTRIENYDIVKKLIKSSSDSRTFQNVEITNKYGTSMPIDLSVSSIKIKENKISGAVITFKNITERRVIEASRQRYEFIVNSSKNFMTLINKNYVYEAVNNAFCKAHKKNRDQIIGRKISDIWGADVFKEAIKKNIDKCLKGENINYSGWLLFPHKKEKRYFDVYLYPFKSGQAVTHCVAVSKDITEYKQQEDELIKLSKVTELTDDAIMITDTTPVIEYVNSSFEKVTGWKKEESLGKNPKILQSGHQSKKYYEDMWKTILSGKHWQAAIVNHKKDGTHYHSLMHIIPIRNEEGKITNYVSIEKDITTEHHLQIQVINMHRMAALTTLSGAVAHEINQPLSGIRVYTQTLVEQAEEQKDGGALTKNVIELGGKIEKQIQRISGIINHMRLFAKDDTKVVREKADLKEIVESVLELMGAQIRGKSIKLKIVIKEELVFMTDEIKLEQVIVNLLNNSKDAFEKTSAQNKTILIEGFSKDENVFLRIKDNAGGIPEKFITNLFEPFVTTKSEDGVTGLGLGLSISRDIMNKLGGDIIIEETSKKGSSFLLKMEKA